VFDEVCVATAVLDDPSRASSEIERVLAAMKTNKRPGYIEVRRDLTNAEIEVVPPKSEAPAQLEAGLLEEALADVRDRLDRAERPVVYAGLEIERFGHRGALLELVEALGVPCATSMAGKAVFPETHPQFVGTYMGAVGPESARAAVEEADLVLALGTLATDVNLGLYTATLDRTRIVHATEDRLRVSHHVYRGVRTGDVIRGIATETRRWSMPSRLQYATGEFSSVGPITVPGIVGLVNRFVTRRSATVC
jgi:indolepyruvate decarboxylase